MDSKIAARYWNHLHWLTVLCEQGSFTAAAERLNISKATMSQHIAELERAVGVALVRRTTRSMALTEAGMRLVADTRGAFDTIARSFVDAQSTAQEPLGFVRVTAPVALARQTLVPLFAEFLQQYPRIRVELHMSDRLASLGGEGFDLAVRHCDQPPDTLVAWQLCTTHSVLVASQEYLLQHGTPAAPMDLEAHACLHYPRGRETVFWSLEKGERASPGHAQVSIAVAGPLTANNSEALRDAAAAGLGIALVPDFSAQPLLRTGGLQRVLPDWRPSGAFAGRIYALRPYSPHVSRAVELLAAFLRDRLAAGFAVDPS